MDYTWLTELLAEFGAQYPAYFEATLAQDLRTVALIFWTIVLFAAWSEREVCNL